MGDAERRRAPRAPVSLKVEYERLNAFFADYTRNISRGGTFIETEQPLALGEEIAFRLFVPTLEAPIELMGIVQWRIVPSEASAEQPAGMGIGFVHESEADRRRVERTVASLMAQELGQDVTDRLIPSSRPPGHD